MFLNWGYLLPKWFAVLNGEAKWIRDKVAFKRDNNNNKNIKKKAALDTRSESIVSDKLEQYTEIVI